MLVIGLTGGIGSGKTAVAKLFAEHGITVIDTDQLSRDVTLPNQPALKEIVNRFGTDILLPNGTLNRPALKKIIFKDDSQRIWLEELLHPLIREEMKRQVDAATSPYCIVVIPLLLETKPNPLIQRILVVDTHVESQIQRTQLRDNSTEEEVKAIINTQVNRTQRLTAAHDVIENNGTLNDLKTQVENLHQFYLGLSHGRT
jgi:dephospho-CoA kinase